MKKLASTNESFYAEALVKIKHFLSENSPNSDLAHFFLSIENLFEIKSPFSRHLMVNGSYRLETIFAYPPIHIPPLFALCLARFS